MSDETTPDTDPVHEALEAIRRFPHPLDPPEAARRCAELLRHPPDRQLLLIKSTRRFGHPQVCESLVAWSYSLRHEDPKAMLALARLAARAAASLPDRGTPRILRADLQGETLLNLSNALRVNNRLREAETALRRARRCLEDGSGDAILAAWSLRREGALRASQRRYREALACYERSYASFSNLGEDHLAGKVLSSIGRTHLQLGEFDQAIRCLLAALDIVEPGRDRTLVIGIGQLLATAMDRAGYPADGVAVLHRVYRLSGPTDGYVLLLRCEWLESQLWAKLRRTERAIGMLERVRSAFTQLDLPFDAAQAALDLAGFYAQLGDMDRVAELAAEMFPVFASLEIHREARLALLSFVKAAQAKQVTAEEIARLAAQVTSRG